MGGGGEYHNEINKIIYNTHWPQLTAPFYSILFETSICQFNSSTFSYNAWRVWRTPDKRSETIPSSRITPDPLDSPLHDGASSLQFTSLIIYRVQVRGQEWPEQKLGFVLSNPFLCCFLGFWGCFPNMAHYKISNRVSHLLIFYLLVFDIIHDAKCLNMMSRTSSRNIGPQHKTQSGVLFIPVFTKPIWSVRCWKAHFLVSSDHRSQSHLKFQSCLITEYAGVCFWMSKDHFSWNPPKQHVVM